ncbi:MAG TPA: SDR family NAD(P)-dependent oxidoreductase [Candidatus Bathyarchaeia archaeon]|nr:SDR family NAD(P)-dependent oxidoreductase [Candidatus Bathyarchaeia archaeon]
MKLQGKVAVVTGASRGAGRGIALALGEQGATVYVTGRSTAAGARTENRPETIEETAAMVSGRGGVGIPVRVDHTDEQEVEALFARVQTEQGKLDLLVNNAWGGNELPIAIQPFWELPTNHWENMFHAGVRCGILSSKYGVPLMLPKNRGLIIHTTSYDQGKYIGHFYYDLAKNALNRMAFGMATELKRHGITVLALSPGWMRTERVLESVQTEEERQQMLEQTETTEYIGRAVCALTADPDPLRMSGAVQIVGELAVHYGFTDVDGRVIPPFVIPDMA